MWPDLKCASSSPGDRMIRPPDPIPSRLMMGLLKTGKRSGGTPCGPWRTPWLSQTKSLL